MPAPDLPPHPESGERLRPLFVHLHTRIVVPETLKGGVVIVIDALRASVTITAALYNGATCVVPVLTVEDATARVRELSNADPAERSSIILGGERGGVLIPGFDLDNSPLKYTRERVAGKIVVFTTTNGTATLLHARSAADVLVGSFVNLSAVCARVAFDPRPVHLLCSGTREEISLDDILPAGAMVERLTAAGRQLVSDDSARVALAAFRDALAQTGGLPAAMLASRGGRNLHKVNLERDVEFCSKLDTLPVVPRFDPPTGRITLA